MGCFAGRSWRGAGIGGGAGAAGGLSSVLLSRGREADLWHSATLDVPFDRPVPIAGASGCVRFDTPFRRPLY